MLPVPERQVDPGLLLDASVGAMLAWRSDSIMLHHLLPLLADLVADAARAGCVDLNDPCSEHWPSERHRWCEGCGLLDLAERVQVVARTRAPTVPVAPPAAGEAPATD